MSVRTPILASDAASADQDDAQPSDAEAGYVEDSSSEEYFEDRRWRPSRGLLQAIAGSVMVALLAFMFWPRESVSTDFTSDFTSSAEDALVDTSDKRWDVNVPESDFKTADMGCTQQYMRALQFSPHAECYTEKFDKKGTCPEMVQERVESILTGKRRIDFASIIYAHGNFELPAEGWAKIYASCPLAGPPSGDDAMLLYNTDAWTTHGSPTMGCLGADYMNHFTTEQLNGTRRDETRRPFIIQAFHHRNSPRKVIVVAAHFPHRVEYAKNMWKLKNVVKKLVESEGTRNVILIADTNQPATLAHAPPAGGAHGKPAGGAHGQPAGGAHGQPAGGTHGQPAEKHDQAEAAEAAEDLQASLEAAARGQPAGGAHGHPAGGAHGQPAGGAHGQPAGGAHGQPAEKAHGGDSASILEDIGAPNTGKVMATQPFRSCCYPGFPTAGYDRIIANFGTSIEDYHPFDKEDVMKWGTRNMHLPVLAEVKLSCKAA